jgi:hypothetical protein
VYQPRVSRETRRLLAAALIALVVLWVIARVRFTDGSAPPPAVTPLLDQFVLPSRLADLAAEVTRVRGRLGPSLAVATASAAPAASSPRAARHHAVLRVAPDMGVVLLPTGDPGGDALDATRLVTDPASGLTLVDLVPAAGVPSLPSWTPAAPEEARYAFATIASADAVALRPVFIARLTPASLPAWTGPVWLAPQETDLVPGAFLFTAAGDLAGLVVDAGREVAIVPPDTLRAEIDRLRDSPGLGGGQIGVDVQDLTPALRGVSGADRGVVVTRVDRDGPGAGVLEPGDVIEAVNGAPIESAERWAVLAARVRAGEDLLLRRRRGGDVQDAPVVAVPWPSAAPTAALGLTMRPDAGGGTRVTAVDPTAAGARAGIRAGDLITRVGRVDAPAPADVRAAFAGARESGHLLVAITRGTSHHVVVVQP